jgi:CRISPR/Cas system-associated exonuclease Cas4 (RecB family)
LIGALQRHIVSENERINGVRDVAVSGYIHPSSASKGDWCPRSSWYEVMGAPATPPPSIGHRLANVFAEGHEIHDKYQRWFTQMGILIGMWECLICGYQQWGKGMQTSCHFCLGDRFRYAEVPVEDEDLMIRGAGDGIVDLDEHQSLIEIKSIGLRSIELDYPKLYKPYKEGTLDLDGLWASIKAPFPWHVRQATLYLHLLRTRWPEINDIIFIYEFKGNQDVKAFTIGYQPELISHIIKSAREIVTAVDEQRVVRRPAWAESPATKTCKVCPYRATCWQGAA